MEALLFAQNEKLGHFFLIYLLELKHGGTHVQYGVEYSNFRVSVEAYRFFYIILKLRLEYLVFYLNI